MTIRNSCIVLFAVVNILYSQTNNVFIKGFVFDKKTNERLTGVTIVLSDSDVAISNSNGYFEFFTKPGKYDISTSMLGYEKIVREIVVDSAGKNLKIFFRLKSTPIEITTVTVTGERFTEKIRYKTYEFLQGDLRRIPQVGEPDALRALQVLPGVTSLNDFSSQVYIRGGNFDETLIMLDEVPVYNPYHLGSGFSMFNTDFIESQKLYLSNYPTRYNGYLSGALNISSKSGNRENLKGSVSVGLISSKGYIEAPIGKGSLILSGRRTYLDLIGAFVFEGNIPYYFYDTYAKFIYPFDKQNLLSVSGFYSRDIFEIFQEEFYSNTKIVEQPNWGNKVVNLQYSHFYGENNSIDVQLFYSKSSIIGEGKSLYQNELSTSLNIDNNISDLTGKISINHTFSGNNIEAGIEYKYLKLENAWNIGQSELSDFGFDLEDTFFDFAPNLFLFNNVSSFYNYFISDKIQLSKIISITLGLNGSYFDKLKKNLLSPSIIGEFRFNDNFEMTLSYGRYYQNIFVIKDQSSVLLDPFSVYFFPDEKKNIPKSDNFSLIANLYNIWQKFDLEIGTYYNKRDRLYSTYKQIPDEVFIEEGYSAGIEILLKRDFKDFGGWISYSLSRSIKSNGSYDYPARADRTHNIKFLFYYTLSESWQLTSFWTFASGNPYTARIGAYVVEAETGNEDENYFNEFFGWNPLLGQKNSARTEHYHRLDIGFNGSFIWGSYYIKPYLQILNVYNSPNPTVNDEYSNVFSSPTKRSSYITPTLGITVEF